MTQEPRIRVGVGGWTFEPWRDNFYPAGLAHYRELEYASRKLNAIEVNGTYYSSQKPASFKKWFEETPDDFMFSLKAIRYATNRRVVAEAGAPLCCAADQAGFGWPPSMHESPATPDDGQVGEA